METNFTDLRNLTELTVREFMSNHNVAGHDIDHFIAVRNHAIKALKHENISDTKKIQVELAAMLHDVDDSKIFSQSVDYQNAKFILDTIFTKMSFVNIVSDCSYDVFKQGIIVLISLVSCSKNGDDDVEESWMAIPRDADRLEAIGKIGIQRCTDYANHIKLPYYLDSTPRAKTSEEALLFATRDRFNRYKNGHKSVSMIDHYYDKLLHIGRPEYLCSNNPYILEKSNKRNQEMIDYVVNFKFE